MKSENKMTKLESLQKQVEAYRNVYRIETDEGKYPEGKIEPSLEGEVIYTDMCKKLGELRHNSQKFYGIYSKLHEEVVIPVNESKIVQVVKQVQKVTHTKNWMEPGLMPAPKIEYTWALVNVHEE